MANWYDLNGALLRIDAEDEALETPLDIYLEELRTDALDEITDFTLAIARGQPPSPPAEAHVLFKGSVPEAEICILSSHGDRRWFFIPNRISLEYSISERSAQMVAAPGYEWFTGATAAIQAIYAALCATGQALVHAAALSVPGINEGFILFAPSGAGKTTTALALAVQGFGLLTDDAAVVTDRPTAKSRVSVWGLPRPPKVHRRTAEMLPMIGRLLGSKWNSEGEQSVSKNALKSVIDFIPGRSFPLSALILLGNRVVGEHRLEPMRKADLLIHLAKDNISRSPLGVLNDDLERFQRFVGLVASMPAYRLNVGSDLSTLGRTIAAAFMADQATFSA